MSGKSSRRLSLENKNLVLENSLLQKKISLAGKTIENSLVGFVSGLTGGDGIAGMSNLTSFNPTLQNNMYAPITLMWTNLMYMYKTHGLIQTAIDMPVLDALRGGLDIHSDGQLDADDISLLEDWMEENAILERVGDAFVWARLFGGGALVINSQGDSEQPLGDELEDGPIELYDACRWELTCERRIPSNGLYGYYGKQVHKSRVLTILGKRAPWLIRAQLSDWGMSEIERMVEDFNLFLRTRNVIYELLQEAKVDVYSLEGFAGQLASSTGTALTTRRIQAMNQVKNFNNALIMDKKDSYEQKQISFGGLAEVMKENRMGIAAALRMPMSKLFGIPSTGFSSGQDDIENYNGMIESEIRQPMRQVLRKVLKLAVRHLFHDDLDVSFDFKPLRILSGVDEENIKASMSARYLNLFDRMLMDSREVGEAMKKDNLVPVPLQAEKGLLDDHPVAAAGQENLGDGDLETGVGGDGPKEAKAGVDESGAVPSTSGKPEKPEKPQKPEKPKLNGARRKSRRDR